MQDQVIGQFNEPMCVITMIFKLRTKALFEFLRLRRKSPHTGDYYVCSDAFRCGN